MRLLSFALLLAPALLAQNFNGQIKLKSLVPPISQPWNRAQSFAPSVSIAKPAGDPRPCSIPLLVVKPENVDLTMLIAPPATGFATRVVTPPAPPCAKTEQ